MCRGLMCSLIQISSKRLHSEYEMSFVVKRDTVHSFGRCRCTHASLSRQAGRFATRGTRARAYEKRFGRNWAKDHLARCQLPKLAYKTWNANDGEQDDGIHPESREENNGYEDKPDGARILLNFRRLAINITKYRNANDKVHPAKNRSLGDVTDHVVPFH
jgi:hypothetical protein